MWKLATIGTIGGLFARENRLDKDFLSLEESVVNLRRRETDLIQRLDDLVLGFVFFAQRGIARSVNDHRLHTCLDSSLYFLDIIAQEEDGISRLAQLRGDLGVTASIMLQAGIGRVEPVVDQPLEVLRAFLIRSAERILNVPKEELLCEDAA